MSTTNGASGGTAGALQTPSRIAMVESDRAAIVRAPADEDALRVFAQVVLEIGRAAKRLEAGGMVAWRDQVFSAWA